jgi:hypothetical protein
MKSSDTGLAPADIQRIDSVDDLPVIKRKVSPTDKPFITRKKGEEMSMARDPVDENVANPNTHTSPMQAVLPEQPGPHQPQPYPQSDPNAPVIGPNQVPQAPQAPEAPAIPIPIANQPPPTVPSLQDHINDLFGTQLSPAEVRAQEAEERLQNVLSRLEAQGTRQPQAPYTNQYGQNPAVDPAADGSLPAGQPPSYVTPDQLQAALAQQTQALAQQSAIQNAHMVSRQEAERKFPDVFTRPELSAAFHKAWSSSPELYTNPRGPEMVAAMIFGMSAGTPSQATAPQVPPVVQKENLSAIGAGNAAPVAAPAPNADQSRRYAEALNIARQSGRLDDFARARRIQLGVE